VNAIDEVDEGPVSVLPKVVIVGYGVAGRLAAQALSACGVPFMVLELNAETVRAARDQGLPVYYGDATSEEALGHAHLKDAQLLILLMNDAQAAQRVVDTATRVAPQVPVLMRTRYLAERETLVKIGARDVVAEEVEGAVEVIARMFRWLEMPRNVIDQQIKALRAETQTTERRLTVPRAKLSEVRGLEEMKIESVLVRSGSPSVGQSPMSLSLRSNTGALVVGVRRGEQLLEKPDPSIPFEVDDIVYFVGTTDEIRRALPLFDPSALVDPP
jgi:CPA2 family monovalent cation:H+ antiporter-2